GQPVSFVLSASPPTHLPPLSLHDALPISLVLAAGFWLGHRHGAAATRALPESEHRSEEGRQLQRLRRESRRLAHERDRLETGARSEEHTSELQSRFDLVCRLLLEKKKTNPTGGGGMGSGSRQWPAASICEATGWGGARLWRRQRGRGPGWGEPNRVCRGRGGTGGV